MYVYTYICAHGRLSVRNATERIEKRKNISALVNLVKHRACNHISICPVEINKIDCVCVCACVYFCPASLLLSVPNKVWRPVAVTIQFGAQAAQTQARLDSLDDGDLRANAKLGLGNPRLREKYFPTQKPPEQSGPPHSPLQAKGPTAAFYKRVRPSFVTLCHLHPTLYLPPAPLVFFLSRIAARTNSYSSHYARCDSRSILEIRGHTLRSTTSIRSPKVQSRTKETENLFLLRFSVCCHTHTLPCAHARTHTHTHLCPSFHHLTRSNPLTRLYPRTRTRYSHIHKHTRNARICLSTRLKHGSVRSPPTLALYRTFTLIVIQILHPRW